MQIQFFTIKHLLFADNLIIQPFSAVAVGAGVFCRLVRVDPAQIISTRAVEIIGAGAAKAEDQFFRDAFDQTDADRQRMVDAANVLFGQMPRMKLPKRRLSTVRNCSSRTIEGSSKPSSASM